MAKNVQGYRTRRQRAAVITAAVVFISGAALAWSLGGGIAAMIDGRGFALAYPRIEPGALSGMLRGEDGALLSIAGGGPRAAWIASSLLLIVLWLVVVIRPIIRRGQHDDTRAAVLLDEQTARRRLSLRAIRKAGAYTRPDLDSRRGKAGSEFGYYIGQLMSDGKKKTPLWLDFESRLRIICRTGWGKSSRLMVPMARVLPGAALIGSVKPDLFEQTVLAREARGAVRVIDFSNPSARISEGFTEVTWNPIAGCGDLTVAQRRAKALVSAADDGDRQDPNDGFWRSSAEAVIAAWLHAADLAGLDMAKVIEWQSNITSPEPTEILSSHPAAERVAWLSLKKHLDDRSEKTTSSVERFIINALGPFASAAGQRFVGAGHQSLDIARSIHEHETIYLLADAATAGSAAPILTLFAEEWFFQARALAAATPTLRLSPPAVACLDELRWLVPLPSLPEIAARDRAAGIGLIYAVQAMHQETELYGAAAETLEGSAVQVSIIGGYDKSAAQTITQQAGTAAVTAVSVGGSLTGGAHFTDSENLRDAVTIADQQRLDDGESILRVAGLPVGRMYTPSFRENRSLSRQVANEEKQVRERVRAAQQLATAARDRRRQQHQREFAARYTAPTQPTTTPPQESAW